MVLAFPVYEMIKQADGSYKYGTEELDTIHLYPKNTVGNDGTLKVTKIGTAENEALNGAEFIISKEEGTPSVKNTSKVSQMDCTLGQLIKPKPNISLLVILMTSATMTLPRHLLKRPVDR